jgi:hypothetical protein
MTGPEPRLSSDQGREEDSVLKKAPVFAA